MSTVSVPRFEPQNRIADKFRLKRRIATGGMGEVWVARNEATQADVALKVLRRGDADRAEELQIEARFRHEARLSAMLSHRSIVKVFDLIEAPGGTLVLVMELLRGETLQRYLEKRGPRSAAEAVAIISPILSALGHAHERGIVHRDVTPSNIFLAVDPDGHVTPKLVDFGIAKLEKGDAPVKTVDGRVLGTPRYMAPERIRGAPQIDGRADVFAAAVVLYETMTGVSPFAASNPAASLAAVLERHIDPDERIEPRLWVEIQRAMSKRPYERHPSAHELAAALRLAIDETEGSLEAVLRRTTTLPGWDEEPAHVHQSEPPPRPRTDEHSAVVLPAKRKLSSAMWLGAGALVGVTVAVLFVAGRGGKVPAGDTGALTPAVQASAAAASATATPTDTATPTPTPTPTDTAAATAATPTHNATPRPRPAHPRPVATTPGF
jgi:eukaryotic-like serine/threonine-protein kinase